MVGFKNLTFTAVILSSFPFALLVLSSMFFLIYANCLMFMKFNRPWWASFIPIYNYVVIADVLYCKSWIGFLTLIPGIGFLVVIILFYQLAKKFKISSLGMILFPFIYIPMIGYGNFLFDDYVFVTSDGDDHVLEKEYKCKKIFLFFTVGLFLVGCVFTFLHFFTDSEGNFELSSNSYYTFAAKQFASKVEKKIEKNDIYCSNEDYSSETGIYYFYYRDISDAVYLPFSSVFNTIGGYVKVDNSMGEHKVFVSISDGSKGFSEILLEDINDDIVGFYNGKYNTEKMTISCGID